MAVTHLLTFTLHTYVYEYVYVCIYTYIYGFYSLQMTSSLIFLLFLSQLIPSSIYNVMHMTNYKPRHKVTICLVTVLPFVNTRVCNLHGVSSLERRGENKSGEVSNLISRP